MHATKHYCGACMVNDQGHLEQHVWVEETRDGTTRKRALDPRIDVHSHSTTGLTWGYRGSGPSQLALAILCDVLQVESKQDAELQALPEDPRFAWRFYQQYKEDVIGALPQNGRWRISECEVRDDLDALMQAMRVDALYPKADAELRGALRGVEERIHAGLQERAMHRYAVPMIQVTEDAIALVSVGSSSRPVDVLTLDAHGAPVALVSSDACNPDAWDCTLMRAAQVTDAPRTAQAGPKY